MINHSSTYITDSHINQVKNTLTQKKLTCGEINKKFSSSLSEKLGFENIDLTSSGTMALFKILKALDLQKGDEVLIPNYICESLLGPIYTLNLVPRLYDNLKDNWLSDETNILDLITVKTKVIIINHTYGFINKSIDKLKKHISSDINLIEDCCHLLVPESQHGKFKKSKYSLCSFFSFNATKFIATGEGGAIGTNNKDFFRELNKINIGDNLSDLSCSLGLAQLGELENFIHMRLDIANYYIEELSSYVEKIGRLNDGLFYRFPVLVNDNEIFMNDTRVSYRLGVDKLLSENIDSENLNNSKLLIQKIVSIPIYPGLAKNQQKIIVDRTKKILFDENNKINR